MIRASRKLDTLRCWLHSFLVFFSIFFVLLLILSRVSIAVMAYHKAFFENQLGKFLNKHLIIQQINVNWFSFHPGFTFNKVIVKDLKEPSYEISVNRLKVSVNLFESVALRKLVLSYFFAQGVQVTVAQDPAFVFSPDHLLQFDRSKALDYRLILNSFFSKIKMHGILIFKNLNLSSRRANGPHYLIENLTFLEKTPALAHQFVSGHAVIKAPFDALLSFNVSLKGNDFFDPQSQAKFYFYLTRIHFSDWFSDLHLNDGLKVSAGEPAYSDLELWGVYKKSQIQSVHGHWIVHNMELQLKQGEKSKEGMNVPSRKRKITLDALDGYFSWKLLASGGGWFLRVNPITLTVNHKKWGTNYFWYRRDYKKSKNYFYIHSLPLSNLNFVFDTIFKFKFSPERTSLNLKGSLKEIYASYEMEAKQVINPSPGANNLNLHDSKRLLEEKKALDSTSLETKQGTFFLLIKKGRVFSNLSPFPFLIHSLTAGIKWKKQPSEYQIDIPSYQFNLNGLLTEGQLSLYSDRSNRMSIQWISHYRSFDLTGLPDFLRIPSLPVSLRKWVQRSLRGGRLEEGTVTYRGLISTPSWKRIHSSVSAEFKLSQLVLSYFQGWPELKSARAHVTVQNDCAQFLFSDTFLGGIPLRHLQMDLSGFEKPTLFISSYAETSFKEIERYFDQVQGLERNKKYEQIKQFEREKISAVSKEPVILRTKFSFNLTHSPIDFLGNGYFSLGKTNSYFYLKSDPQKINLKIKGHLPVNERQNIGTNKRKSEVLYRLSGQTNYEANVKIYKNSKSLLMEADVFSDLKGLQVSGLLHFINKSREEKSPIHFHVELHPDQTGSLFLQNENRLYSQFFFDTTSRSVPLNFLSGEVNFGLPAPKAIPRAPPKKAGLWIQGHLKEISWVLSDFFIKQFFVFEHGCLTVKEVLGLPVQSIRIDLDRFKIFKKGLHRLSFHFYRVPFHSVFSLHSDEIKGELFAPNYPGGTWVGNFDSLNLSDSYKDDFSKINWNLFKKVRFIPPIDFFIKNFSYRGIPYGRMKLKVVTYGRDELIGQFFLVGPLVTISVNGKLKEHPGQKTELFGGVATKNLGKLLRSLGVAQPVMTKGQGGGSFHLFWPGFPEEVSLKKLSGYFSFDIRQGRLMVADKKMMKLVSLARLINVFRVESLPQRLTLNFSDIAKEGLQFYSISGGVTMSQGVFHLPRVLLEGPIVSVKIKGSLNYLTEQYDFFVHIRPYFTFSLPVVIGLISGPVFGAIAWVVNEITAPQLGKAVGFVYHLKGDLGSFKKNDSFLARWNSHRPA